VTRPNDSNLDAHQLATVLRHADRVLREASAHGRFPTPISDILASASLVVVENEVLNASVLQQFLKKAKDGFSTVIKSALGKVLGLFDATDRLVVIDKNVPEPRVPFIKLHEAGHGSLPHQSTMYRLMQDCKRTLDPDIADLFEREANVFASEVLFQGKVFSQEALSFDFGIKVPMDLAKKFGASMYSTFRRYVLISQCACCVVVLELPSYNSDGGFTADVRRVVMSKSFDAIYDEKALSSTVTRSHPLGPVVPAKRMTFQQEVVLIDRNQHQRLCVAEALNTKHQILILLRDIGSRTKSGIVMPRVRFPSACL
jgi:Zn-dependent peptidase ImmA (M78 family)